MAVDVKYWTEDASNNNVSTKKVDLFTKKPEVDLSFEDLTFTVNTFDKFKMGKCQRTVITRDLLLSVNSM